MYCCFLSKHCHVSNFYISEFAFSIILILSNKLTNANNQMILFHKKGGWTDVKRILGVGGMMKIKTPSGW